MSQKSEEQKLRQMIADERAKLEGRYKQDKKKDKISKLKAEFRAVRFQRIKKSWSPILNPLGKAAKFTDQFLTGVEISRQMKNSGLKAGSVVLITNGILTGKSLKIDSFINGGIQGKINGQTVRIRHGSYRPISL